MCRARSPCATGGSSPNGRPSEASLPGPAGRRRSAGRRSECAAARCGPPSRPPVSPSAWRRWWPSSAFRRRVRPSSWPRSMRSARTCSRCRPTPPWVGRRSALPSRAPAMIARIGPVTADAATAQLADQVYRSRCTSRRSTARRSVSKPPDSTCCARCKPTCGQGRFLNPASARLPAVVLGHDSAAALGVDRAGGRVTVWLGRQLFDVVGILDPVTLAPELDRSA